MYKGVEGALLAAGINGKACLLRAICEMQTRELGHYSLAGELALFLLRYAVFYYLCEMLAAHCRDSSLGRGATVPFTTRSSTTTGRRRSSASRRTRRAPRRSANVPFRCSRSSKGRAQSTKNRPTGTRNLLLMTNRTVVQQATDTNH